MRSFAATTFAILASTTAVLGHATFQQLWVDGVDQGSTCARLPPSNSPVENVSSPNMVCNAGTSPVPGICAINAGSKVTVEMHQHNDRDCTKEAIGGAHHGPVIVYMSKVSDATKVDGTEGTWIKVAEEGYDPATKKWADDNLNANCGKKEFTVPADLATGDYLIRAEEIALHAAGGPNGAQLYMTCYQVHVEGTGSAVPQGVKFPGAYSATDPGILINIYQQLDDYIIPGPELYKSGGSGGSSPAPPPSVPTTTRPAPVPSSTVGPVTTLAPSSSAVLVPSSSAAPTSTQAPTPKPEVPTPGPVMPAPVPEVEEDCEEL